MIRNLYKALILLLSGINCFKRRIKPFLSRYRKYIPGTSIEEVPRGKNLSRKPFFFPESMVAHKYCVGKGLEIGGSAHNPFGLETLNVDFTDSMDTPFKKNEIDLSGKALPVDIVAYGDDIPLADASQDFIVSSHVIEHFPDPIKALLEWDRLIKTGGIIFLIIPHKDRTFDKGNKSTLLEHLIEDYKNGNLLPHENSSGHDHCWVTVEFIELIRYIINYLGVHWEILEVQDVDDKVGNGFTVVLRKLGIRNKEKPLL